MRDTLALYGGEKTAREPFPAWPLFSDKAISDARAPLQEGRAASWAGTRCAALETRVAAWIGAPHAVSCSSGTAALSMALVALGVGPGHEVILPARTFASGALAVLQAGARPVFCDVAEDQVIDPRAAERLVTPRTRAIVAVHLFGIACDMHRLAEVARRHSLRVVEDCAQSMGAECGGRRAGAWGDAACFSFAQGKHVSTGGEGGMVVTGDPAVATACRELRDYGRASEGERAGAHVRVGFNFRLTEMQAAVGLAELERLDSWNLPRRAGFARIYDHAFSHLPGVKAVPLSTPERRSAWLAYPLQVDLPHLTCGGDELRRALEAEGIPDGGGHWPETYREPLFADDGADGAGNAARCPTAEALRERTLVLCLHPTWEKQHVETCIAAVKKLLRAYRR